MMRYQNQQKANGLKVSWWRRKGPGGPTGLQNLYVVLTSQKDPQNFRFSGLDPKP